MATYGEELGMAGRQPFGAENDDALNAQLEAMRAQLEEALRRASEAEVARDVALKELEEIRRAQEAAVRSDLETVLEDIVQPARSGDDTPTTITEVELSREERLRMAEDPREFTVSIDKANGGSLGIRTKSEKPPGSSSVMLGIERVSELSEVGTNNKAPLIPEWNARNPHKAVREGDFIVEVNGRHRGEPNKLLDELKQSTVLTIVFWRADSNESAQEAIVMPVEPEVVESPVVPLHFGSEEPLVDEPPIVDSTPVDFESRRKSKQAAELEKIQSLMHKAYLETQERLRQQQKALEEQEALKRAHEMISVYAYSKFDQNHLVAVVRITRGSTGNDLVMSIIRDGGCAVPPTITFKENDIATPDTLSALGIDDGERVVAEVFPAIASSSADKTVKIWNIITGTCEMTLTGHAEAVYAASFAPDCKSIVTASEDRTAKIWSLDSGRCVKVLIGHDGAVYSACFSPDCKTVLTASEDGFARTWMVQTGDCKHRLGRHSSPVLWATFSPEGDTITSISRCGTSKTWDAKTGTCLESVLLEHLPSQYAISFATDGLSYAISGGDTTARVVERESGDVLCSLSGHDGVVMSASFAPTLHP